MKGVGGKGEMKREREIGKFGKSIKKYIGKERLYERFVEDEGGRRNKREEKRERKDDRKVW